MYNITDKQKSALRWIVKQVEDERLGEEFSVLWGDDMAIVGGYKGNHNDYGDLITKGTLDALTNDGFLMSNVHTRWSSSSKNPRQYEASRNCVLTQRAYQAVESNFDAPDTSFVKQLTPLADISNFDDELKKRCLPILGAGAADPTLWDSAVRTAGVILEERLRDVGKISQLNLVGRALVNEVFGKNGTLSNRIPLDSEREGYRDLFAGIVGAFRNTNAHRLTDPTPDNGGAYIVFINLLLKLLDDLR